VTHPDVECARQTAKQGRLRDDVDLRVAVLAGGSRFHAAAEVMHDELQSIADAEQRNAQREQRRIGGGRVGVVDRTGTSGKDETQRGQRANLVQRRGAGEHHRKDVELADAASDELGVLRAEVQNDDCRGVHEPIVNAAGETLSKRWLRIPPPPYPIFV
jgi:hypothetical protein